MKRSLFLAAALLFAVTAFAQDAPSVTLVSAPAVKIAPGRTAVATLTFKIGPGMHINSHKPLSDLLLPTELKLSPPSYVMASRIDYPEGEQLNFPFSPEEKLSVYSGEFRVKVLLRAAQTAGPGQFRVHGELKFQACNDRQCFPPKKTPVDVDVLVARASRR